MKAFHRIGRAFLLALAFAWAQQATLAHALAHAVEPLSSHESGLPAPSQCAEHSAYVQVASGVASSSFDTPFVAALPPRVDTRLAAGVFLEPRLAFRAQAPPSSDA